MTHKCRCTSTHSSHVREGSSGCISQQRHNQVTEMYKKSLTDMPCSSRGELPRLQREPRDARWARDPLQSCHMSGLRYTFIKGVGISVSVWTTSVAVVPDPPEESLPLLLNLLHIHAMVTAVGTAPRSPLYPASILATVCQIFNCFTHHGLLPH